MLYVLPDHTYYYRQYISLTTFKKLEHIGIVLFLSLNLPPYYLKVAGKVKSYAAILTYYISQLLFKNIKRTSATHKYIINNKQYIHRKH